MSARTILAENRQQLAQLQQLADRDLAALLAATQGMSVADVRNTLIEVLPGLMGPYVTASGELSAVLFEDLRAEAGRRGTFYAEAVTSLPPASRVESVARWGVTPLADGRGNAAALSMLSGAVGEWVVGSGMDTMAVNSARDMVGYQRMPRANACAFCQMLASQSSLYDSERAATRVVGVGSDRTGYDEDGKRLVGGIGGGVKPRKGRKGKLGDPFHNKCHCVAVPVYMGTEMGELASRSQADYERKHAAAVKVAGTNETSAVLAAWRQLDSIR